MNVYGHAPISTDAQKVLRVSEIVIWPEPAAGSLGPGARKFDHLGPFLSIVDDEVAELGRGRRHGRTAEVGKAGLQARVREHGVECRIQLIDDFERRSA